MLPSAPAWNIIGKRWIALSWPSSFVPPVSSTLAGSEVRPKSGAAKGLGHGWLAVRLVDDRSEDSLAEADKDCSSIMIRSQSQKS